MTAANPYRPGKHPDTPSPEQSRYFSTRKGGLFSLREDGTIYVKRPTHNWRIAQPRPTDPIEHQRRIEMFAGLRAKAEPWRSRVDDVPSQHELERWAMDSVCESVTGDTVEPDGRGCDGAPSWLMAFGLL